MSKEEDENEDISVDDIELPEEEEEEKGKKGRKKKGKSVRRSDLKKKLAYRESMDLPAVLKALNGEEVLNLLNYLMFVAKQWLVETESIKYSSMYEKMFSNAVSLISQMYQPPQIPQEETTEQKEVQTPQIEYQPIQAPQMPQIQMPSNPFDRLIYSLFYRIADQIVDRLSSNPDFINALTEVTKTALGSAVQETVARQVQQIQQQQVQQQIQQENTE